MKLQCQYQAYNKECVCVNAKEMKQEWSIKLMKGIKKGGRKCRASVAQLSRTCRAVAVCHGWKSKLLRFHAFELNLIGHFNVLELQLELPDSESPKWTSVTSDVVAGVSYHS